VLATYTSIIGRKRIGYSLSATANDAETPDQVGFVARRIIDVINRIATRLSIIPQITPTINTYGFRRNQDARTLPVAWPLDGSFFDTINSIRAKIKSATSIGILMTKI
jgi:hypothetical protein